LNKTQGWQFDFLRPRSAVGGRPAGANAWLRLRPWRVLCCTHAWPAAWETTGSAADAHHRLPNACCARSPSRSVGPRADLCCAQPASCCHIQAAHLHHRVSRALAGGAAAPASDRRHLARDRRLAERGPQAIAQGAALAGSHAHGLARAGRSGCGRGPRGVVEARHCCGRAVEGCCAAEIVLKCTAGGFSNCRPVHAVLVAVDGALGRASGRSKRCSHPIIAAIPKDRCREC
jgi:hypothetical protein